VTLNGLDLGNTTHTDAGDYPDDAWTFTNASGNYNNDSGTVDDKIAKAGASCSVTPYTLTYDGSSHTATGSCSGIGGGSLSGLDLSGTTHTDAGDYPDDAWILRNSNYLASDTVHDILKKTSATCSISGYTGVYDGLSHGATGSCISANGLKLPGLNLGLTFKSVPGGSAYWSFTNTNVSNPPLSGIVNITLSLAPSTVTVTCPASVPYTGSVQTPCTANGTGAAGLNQALTVSYSGNTVIGTATASASYAGDANHSGGSGSTTFSIISATLAGVPLINPEGAPVAANHKGESGAGLDIKAAVFAAAFTNTPPVPTALPTSTKSAANAALGVNVKSQNNSKSGSNNFWATYSGLFGCIGTGFLGLLIFFMFKRRKDDDTEENGADNS
jgi:hypothetical protein